MELNDLSANARRGDRMLMSAQRNPATGKIKLFVHREGLPIEIAERFLAAVREEWAE